MSRSLRLSLVLLAACTPKPDPGEETTGLTGSTSPATGTSDETPTTTQGSSSTGDSTGDLSATAGSSTTTVETTSTSSPDDTSIGETTATSTGIDDTSTTTTGQDDTTSTSTGPGETDGPPDTTGGELCDDPGDVKAQWSLAVPPALAGKDITADCTVVSAAQQGLDVTAELSCLIANVKHAITVHYTVDPETSLDAFMQGAERHLEYRATQPFWTNEWLAVTAEDSLYMAAIRGDALAPPGESTTEFFKEGISLHAPCDAVPDRCGQRQALGLGLIEHHTRTLEVTKSGHHGSVGPFIKKQVYVEHASRLLEPNGCDDAPPRWIEAIVLHDGSGA